ncbi:MAG: rhodanese-like domain-containing protein [Leptospiraceae bacterium]|nr:rhodanese-like domain-containing protein [Leptospiraceae bacterium]
MDETHRGTWINISALELKEIIEKDLINKNFFLLDVRNPTEQEICVIPHTDLLIPVKELSKRLHEVPKDKKIIVYCKSGVRSKTACEILSDAGWRELYHLEGGVLEYIEKVDPSLASY